MTPEQCERAAAHVDLVLDRVRRSRWREWSEAESSALEILCTLAVSFDGTGSFTGYLLAHFYQRLNEHHRKWARSRTYRPVVTGFVELDAVTVIDEHRGPDEIAVAADTARRELGRVPACTLRIARMIDAGMDRQDVAVELGVSVSRVGQHLRCGQQRIVDYRRSARC